MFVYGRDMERERNRGVVNFCEEGSGLLNGRLRARFEREEI